MRKIKRSQIYLILLVALLLHLTLLNHIKIYGAKPDLILLCVVFFGLFLGPGAGLESGAFAGILCDMFTLDFFGINALVYGLSGLVAGLLGDKVFKESKRTEFAIVFFFTVFSMTLHFIIVSILSRSIGLTFFEYFFTSMLPSGLYTALVSVPIFVKFIDMYNFKELQGLL